MLLHTMQTGTQPIIALDYAMVVNNTNTTAEWTIVFLCRSNVTSLNAKVVGYGPLSANNVRLNFTSPANIGNIASIPRTVVTTPTGIPTGTQMAVLTVTIQPDNSGTYECKSTILADCVVDLFFGASNDPAELNQMIARSVRLKFNI